MSVEVSPHSFSSLEYFVGGDRIQLVKPIENQNVYFHDGTINIQTILHIKSMARTKSPRTPARDRILAAASELFYREGVHQVGVDRIVAESGVAKMSLYNHFKSKDALIGAWLEQQGEQWRRWFRERVEAVAPQPGDRLLAVFDVLEEWFRQPDFRGCPFINSSVELVNPEHPGYQMALQHQQAIVDYMRGLVEAARLSNAETLTQQLVILMEGAIVVAMMQRNSNAAKLAQQAAAASIASNR